MKSTVLRERNENTPDEFKLESKSWDGVPSGCTRLWVDASKTKQLGPLVSFAKLKTLTVCHVRNQDCETLVELTGLKTLFLVVPNITSLVPLTAMSRLEGLSLMHGARLLSFSGIEGMGSLKYLHAYNIPRVNDLTPLGKLSELRELDLQMSWATTKMLSFKTLKPLSGLQQLQLLDLRGVRPVDESLHPLGSLKKLKWLFPCHLGMPVEELAYLAAVLNRQLAAEDRLFPTKPIKKPQAAWMCKSCGGPPVQLVGRVGKRYRWTACPVCDATSIAERNEVFEAAKRRCSGKS